MLLIFALIGAGAAGWSLWDSAREEIGFFGALFDPLRYLESPGLLISLAVIVWVILTWVRNHNKRGYAITGFALLKVRGHKLVLLRHVDVARIELRYYLNVPGSNMVLNLSAQGGRRLKFSTLKEWALAAVEAIERARAAAGLPPAPLSSPEPRNPEASEPADSKASHKS